MPDENQNYFKLPPSVAQPSDINHILHELSLIDEHLNQENIREPEKRIAVKSSVKLDDLLKINNLDVTNKTERTNLISQLEHIKANAPTINLSFSTDAQDDFIQKISEWFRREVDPYCLIVVGLEPTIGIGSIVRTTNKVFDFSLKNRLKYTSNLLIKEIKELDLKSTS